MDEKIAFAIARISDVVFFTDKNGCIEFVNPAFERLSGYSGKDVLGKTPRILTSGTHDTEFYKTLWQTISGGGTFRGVMANKDKDGAIFYLDETITPMLETDGKVRGFMCVGRNITETVRIEEALQQSNEKLISWVNELEQRNTEMNYLSEMADLLQTCETIDEARAVVLQTAQKLFPNDAGALYLMSNSRSDMEPAAAWGGYPDVRIPFAPQDCWAIRRGHAHIVADSSSGLNCRHLRKPIPSSYLCIPMMAHGEAMGMLHLEIESREGGDSAEMKKLLAESRQRLAVTLADQLALSLSNLKLRETLRNQAIRDPLTGLFNRRFMEESLERELHRARRNQSSIGIIMTDIDFFKKFNDSFGHAAGDAMLREVAAFLKNGIRKADIACRYGGEEFTIILPQATLEQAGKCATQLWNDAKNVRIEFRSEPLGRLTLSLGVAAFPQHGDSVDELLQAADKALYKAKENGRDQVVIWNPPA